MTSGDQELHTLAGAYVLDAVSDDERVRFAAHLAGCAQCRDEVDELREAAARLGTAQSVRPRPELREPTIRAAYRTRQMGPVTAEDEPGLRPASGAGPRRKRATRGLVAAAAVAIAAGIGIGTHYVDMQHQLAINRVDAVLSAPDALMRTAPIGSGGMAIVVSSRREHMAVFIAHGLRRPPPASRYELWLMGPRGERAAGMLAIHPKGMAGPALIAGQSAGDMVGLTIEPESGSSRPTSPPVVMIGPTGQ
jgi:Anti-sigma-K factor rskA/Putative zinc-finger